MPFEGGVTGQSRGSAFRSGVDLVSLNVTVSDGSRRHVADLTREEFVVTENGVPQDLSHFSRASNPLALALLIDTSASMRDDLATAQEAAIGFVRQLAPEDGATVIDFDNRVQTAQEFTRDKAALERAVRETAADGSTALYNAVYIALRALNKLVPQDSTTPRRRAIVLLSDGDDTASLINFDEVADLAARSDTTIYTIGLGGQQAAVGPVKSDGSFVLRRLAHQTGGRAFFPGYSKDLAAVYSSIRDELTSQYSLAYEPSPDRPDGKWRVVSVRVNRPGLVARTRQGYYARLEARAVSLGRDRQ